MTLKSSLTQNPIGENWISKDKKYSRLLNSIIPVVKISEVMTISTITNAIINLLGLIGINIVYIDNPAEGYSIIGYDATYGLMVKDYNGNLTKILLQY